MALFRAKVTESSVCIMDIEADNVEEAEDFFTVTRYYRSNAEEFSLITCWNLGTTDIHKETALITEEEAHGFVHAPYDMVKKELDWCREKVLAKQRKMKYLFDQYMDCRITSMDMIQHEDLYWCLFRLLMQRQVEEYENGPLGKASRQLAAELTKMDQMRRSYEVAVLFELTLWLRENHYHWYCSPEMKNSIMLYLLGITNIKPKLQSPSVWASADPTFEIVVQAGAFGKLEELFEDHWFTQVCNQHYEIDRKCSNTAKYGYIIFMKEGEKDYGKGTD